MPRPRKYSDELRERAVRLVFESGRPIAHVALDLGIHKESLRTWVRQAEADAGQRKDRLTTGERERLKQLRAREPRAAQGERDLEVSERVFREGARRDPAEVSAFIDEQKAAGFTVELCCKTLGVSASAYYQRATGERSDRAVADERLLEQIHVLHAANYHAYGYRRTWKALQRAGVDVGRDRVRRGCQLFRVSAWCECNSDCCGVKW